ncbi:MAG: hypothetical protein FVQ06_05910 [candidate division NC10 bacterium]|nr:hypothetical protein [candidate division NC10 bacterium]
MSTKESIPAGMEGRPAVLKSRAWHGWIGWLLVGVSWPLNWLLPGLRTHVLFFPLWLGYTLIVDALVLRRTGSSLLTRSPRDFGLLFVISAPAWWLFEVINWRTGNWQYLGGELFSNVEYFVLASVSFSTVIPAVLSTAQLMGSFGWIERFARGPRISATPRVCWGLFLSGCAMLGLVLAWPRYFYPLVWASLFCLLEPMNVWLGKRSILTRLQYGDWRTVIALCMGTLTCGFFWEMWNYFSYPKWIYHVPFANFWHLFEMPLLGYLGYLPFGLELYVLVHLVQRRTFELQIGN